MKPRMQKAFGASPFLEYSSFSHPLRGYKRAVAIHSDLTISTTTT